MIGIAGMIGGSIFVLSGPAIGLAGSAVIIAFILNAIITIFTALAYAELGSAMPEAGGGYLWIREGLPRPNAFISGWLAWFAHIVAGSLYAIGFGALLFNFFKLFHFFPNSVDPFGIISIDKIIAVISIVLFTYINIKGASETGRTGTIVTVFQIAIIIILICVGIWTINSEPSWHMNFSDFLPLGISGLIAAMGLTFIAFEGYEIIVQTGEEVKSPKRNIPRAIFISLAIVVTLYCLIAFVAIGASHTEDGTPTWKFIGNEGAMGISKAVESFLPYGALLVLIAGLVSTLAALNATTFSSSRVAFAMGRHYNLPHQLSSIHTKNKTPHIATLISGIIMAIMASILPLEQIALASGVIFLLLFTQVNIAVITIRRMYGDKLKYGFKIPFFPIVPIIGIFLNLGLAVYLLITSPLSWVITIIWVLAGFTIYRLYTFKREIDHYAPIITSEGDLTRKDFRILMPYTPENPDRLIRYAVNLAHENDGEINVLRIITVPDQTPLSAGVAFSESARKSFLPLEKILDNENIMNHYLVRISHDTIEAVLATIEEQKIDLLITDFETLRNNRKLQTLVTCDIVSIKITGDDNTLFNSQSAESDHENISHNNQKKNLVAIYDGSNHSDIALKTTRWLEKSGNFKTIILAINNRDIDIKNDLVNNQHEEYNTQKFKQLDYYLDTINYEVNEIYLSHTIEKNSKKSADLILSAINALQPDLLITSANIGKFNFLHHSDFVSLLNQLNCPVVVTKDFAIPVVHDAKLWITKLLERK